MEAQGHSLSDQENCSNVVFCGDDYLKACQGADAIVVATEWDQFQAYNYEKIASVMATSSTFYDFRCYL